MLKLMEHLEKTQTSNENESAPNQSDKQALHTEQNIPVLKMNSQPIIAQKRALAQASGTPIAYSSHEVRRIIDQVASASQIGLFAHHPRDNHKDNRKSKKGKLNPSL
ncbi:hypothetical protein ACNVED_04190 [Legionella sp. D16C41]|uniref:hypothetical protein n=1 Tax=Legionella sp. D16C41 TaxID=3402688 RepID=UPI003AF57DF5